MNKKEKILLYEYSKKNNPSLIDEWDYKKNGAMTPHNVTVGSNKKAWWKCKYGHSWESIIANRTYRNRNCPICSGQKVLKGYNDVATTHPQLLKYWDYTKNINIQPTDITWGSNKKVWWRCDNGHSWQALIRNRKSPDYCPYCNYKKLLVGFNDLETVKPSLLKEWDYKKNKNLNPCNILARSTKKVWWICDLGHSWKASVYDRNCRNHGCPECGKALKTSFNEQAIFYYIKKQYKNAINGDRAMLNGKELDVYIPDLNVGIEYDDAWTHKNLERDLIKNELCYNIGIALFRLRSNDCPRMGPDSYTTIISFDASDEQDFTKALKKLLKLLNVQQDINIERDRFKIFQEYLKTRKSQSLQYINPELVKEWDYIKNQNLSPIMFSSGSAVKVWWKCKNGHSWQAPISSRNKGIGCPVCSGKKVLEGYNDLASVNPELLKEWDYNKNLNTSPEMIHAGSTKKVWWKCKFGHSWKASIAHRNKLNRGCPICSGHEVLEGYNDLASKFPHLIKEWDFEKNGKITPYDVSWGSSKKVWWKCNEGHSWQTTISLRSSGSKCPICSGNKILKGFNDLTTTNPEIALEWDYEKNNGLLPSQFTSGSSKIVWWKCNEGHSWQSQINSRRKGSKCPVCSGKKVLVGYNDLATTDPSLASEWDYERNGDFKPTDITSGSGKKAWWRCSLGHVWEAPISRRRQGIGCPICAGKKVLKGYNDLATMQPHLADEWDYKKNGNLTPSDVTAGSGKKVWWKCKFGHSWQAKIYLRSSGSNCPMCWKNKGKKV